MAEHNKHLITWLNDAYAMEVEITKILESHKKAAEDFPQVEEKIDEHLEVTKKQAERLKKCIEGLGESVSSTKSVMATVMGMIAGPTTGLFDDAVIKNSALEFATEHFEISVYRVLIAAADKFGHDDIVDICQQNMQEEEEMAEWLDENMDSLVNDFLGREKDS